MQKESSVNLLVTGVKAVVFKKNKAENEKQIRYRDRLIVGLFILLCLVIIGWMRMQREITLHYPPDLRAGAVMKAGEIPDYEVYAFVTNIFTYLNTWNEDGQYDYPANRKRLRAYLTSKYQKQILAEVEKLTALGEIQGRTRTIQPLQSDYYTEDKVQVINGSTWIVMREFRVREYLDGTLIKDVALRFPIRVVVYSVPREANPWQLGIDGFQEDPERIPYLKGEIE